MSAGSSDPRDGRAPTGPPGTVLDGLRSLGVPTLAQWSDRPLNQHDVVLRGLVRKALVGQRLARTLAAFVGSSYRSGYLYGMGFQAMPRDVVNRQPGACSRTTRSIGNSAGTSLTTMLHSVSLSMPR